MQAAVGQCGALWYECCEGVGRINQKPISVKTIVSTFALPLALCAVAGAAAQSRNASAAPAADSVLLSEQTDGDYLVRKYRVQNSDDAGYSVRYRINAAQLSSTLDDNAKELDALNAFVGSLDHDTTMRVVAVNITGYASPDGPQAFNRTLARSRAQDFRSYLDRKYRFSKRYDVKLSSEVESWAACRAAVAQSAIPDRQAVLNIIDGGQPAAEKQQALEQMPAAWDYMRAHILPPMRRVEVRIDYGRSDVVVQRTMIPRPRPVPEPAPEPESACAPTQTGPCCDIVVDESITGILVEMPEPGEDNVSVGRGGRAVGDEQAVREARAIEKAAARERAEAERLARMEREEARRIARREAKAAAAAEKAAERAARKAAAGM